MSAFGKSEHQHLYPSDVNKRALVDLFLQFDLSTMYQRTLEYFFPTIILGAPLDESKKARLSEALGFLESMLKNKKFATGDDFTLADLTLCVTVSQIEAFKFGLNPFPKVRKWLVECKNELEPYGYNVSSMTLMNLFGFRVNACNLLSSHRRSTLPALRLSLAYSHRSWSPRQIFYSTPSTIIVQLLATVLITLAIEWILNKTKCNRWGIEQNRHSNKITQQLHSRGRKLNDLRAVNCQWYKEVRVGEWGQLSVGCSRAFSIQVKYFIITYDLTESTRVHCNIVLSKMSFFSVTNKSTAVVHSNFIFHWHTSSHDGDSCNVSMFLKKSHDTMGKTNIIKFFRLIMN